MLQFNLQLLEGRGQSQWPMMKLLLWNVKGLGRKEKMSKIKSMLKAREVDIALFQETKKVSMSENEVNELWARESMNFICVDTDRTTGGLLCIWDP